MWIVLMLSSLIPGGLARFSPSRPTVVDQALPLLKNELARNNNVPNESNPVSVENVQYKCQVLSVLYAYWTSTFGQAHQQDIRNRLTTMLDECGSPNFKPMDILNHSMIFPGTNWCGQHNIAKDDDDLGVFNRTDSCCRSHDLCDDVIQAGKRKHNLVNPYSTTRLNCKCDDDLRSCFREVNSVISNTMGYIFFSMLQTQCFKFEHPSMGCAAWARGPVRRYCSRYRIDESKPKIWQWFDQEPYF